MIDGTGADGFVWVTATGVFAIIASMVGSFLLIRSDKKKRASEVETSTQNDIASLKANQHNVCPQHIKSFSKAYNDIEKLDGKVGCDIAEFKEDVIRRLETFSGIVVHLDKTVAVFTSELKTLCTENTERKQEINRIWDKINTFKS